MTRREGEGLPPHCTHAHYNAFCGRSKLRILINEGAIFSVESLVAAVPAALRLQLQHLLV